jgi:hypothetical protein
MFPQISSKVGDYILGNSPSMMLTQSSPRIAAQLKSARPLHELEGDISLQQL